MRSSPDTASRSVLPTVAIRTPRSAARRRSTATWISGFETLRLSFGSARLGSRSAAASACIEYSLSCFRSGPSMLAEMA